MVHASSSIWQWLCFPYNNVIMSAMASHITNLTIVYSTVYSGTDERKHQISASLALVSRNHQWPVNSPHKGPVTRKMFPLDNLVLSCFVLHPIDAAMLANAILSICVREMDKWLTVIYQDKYMGNMVANAIYMHVCIGTKLYLTWCKSAPNCFSTLL